MGRPKGSRNLHVVLRPPTVFGDSAVLYGPNGELWTVDADTLTTVGHLNWARDTPSDYAMATIEDKKRVRLHALIMRPDPGYTVDHISGNAYDNRRANLRVCRADENGRNLPISKANTSGAKGVSWYKAQQCWRAYIVRNRKQHHLGYFDTKDQAADAYARAASELFGEFVRDESALHNKQRS